MLLLRLISAYQSLFCSGASILGTYPAPGPVHDQSLHLVPTQSWATRLVLLIVSWDAAFTDYGWHTDYCLAGSLQTLLSHSQVPGVQIPSVASGCEELNFFTPAGAFVCLRVSMY
jgi:hypothetical protein